MLMSLNYFEISLISLCLLDSFIRLALRLQQDAGQHRPDYQNVTDVVHVAVHFVKVLKVKEPEGNGEVRTEHVVEYSLAYILNKIGTPIH